MRDLGCRDGVHPDAARLSGWATWNYEGSERKPLWPAYEQIMKASHSFNMLDARGAISVTERAAYIGRVRTLSRLVAQAYYDSREKLGFPMAPKAAA